MREESYTNIKQNLVAGEAFTASGFSPSDLESFAYGFLEEKIKENIKDIQRVLYIYGMSSERNLIDETTITYELVSKDSPRAIATAYHTIGRISFYKAKLLNKNIDETYIHELAHIVTYRTIGITGHCLEFAIINYCLRKKYKGGQIFFNSYDIHEDKAYRFLCINPSEFDSLITSIEFESFEELSNKASKLAKKIREKSVPMGLAILEDE